MKMWLETGKFLYLTLEEIEERLILFDQWDYAIKFLSGNQMGRRKFLSQIDWGKIHGLGYGANKEEALKQALLGFRHQLERIVE